jgi:hypothetical protein
VIPLGDNLSPNSALIFSLTLVSIVLMIPSKNGSVELIATLRSANAHSSASIGGLNELQFCTFKVVDTLLVIGHEVLVHSVSNIASSSNIRSSVHSVITSFGLLMLYPTENVNVKESLSVWFAK